MLDWKKYIEIASKFQRKAKPADREDLKQDIILKLAEVESKYNGSGETLTEGGMVRVASYTVMAYWREIMRLPPITSLNETLDDGDGNETELYQMLADDKAIDVEAWLDARLWLYRAPPRLIRIAYKKVSGKPLEARESEYLRRFKKNFQKSLF
jgi:DNA-directed RNA polymerase specialized sigma24 family protein